MELEELAQAIKTRRSVRKWQDKPVPKDLLLKAIELATWAPNAGNRQNWHFYLVLDRDVLNGIVQAVADSSEMIASWPEAKNVPDLDAPTLVRRSTFFRGAPAMIVVATSQYQSANDLVLAEREKVDPAAKEIRKWRKSANPALQSAGAAIAYLLLVLHQMGLGAVWIAVYPHDEHEQYVRGVLDIPETVKVICLVPVGYPAEDKPPGTKYDSTKVHFDRFNSRGAGGSRVAAGGGCHSAGRR